MLAIRVIELLLTIYSTRKTLSTISHKSVARDLVYLLPGTPSVSKVSLKSEVIKDNRLVLMGG
jgi:hypothetical protein